MKRTERQLLEALTALESAANRRTDGAKPDLIPLFARIDDLGARLDPDCPPRLRHFLKQKSYAKARLFLQESAARE